MAEFPVEVLDGIIAYTCQQTQANLCRVSSWMYSVAVQHLYRSMEFTSPESVVEFCQLCLAKPVIAAAVESVSIASFLSFDLDPSVDELIPSAFNKLHRLRRLKLCEILFNHGILRGTYPSLVEFHSALRFDRLTVGFLRRHQALRAVHLWPSISDAESEALDAVVTMPNLNLVHGHPETIPCLFPHSSHTATVIVNWGPGNEERPHAPVIDALAGAAHQPSNLATFRKGWDLNLALLDDIASRLKSVVTLFMHVAIPSDSELHSCKKQMVKAVAPHVRQLTNLTHFTFIILARNSTRIPLARDLDYEWTFLQQLGHDCTSLTTCSFSAHVQWTRLGTGSRFWIPSDTADTSVSDEWLQRRLDHFQFTALAIAEVDQHPELRGPIVHERMMSQLKILHGRNERGFARLGIRRRWADELTDEEEAQLRFWEDQLSNSGEDENGYLDAVVEEGGGFEGITDYDPEPATL